MVWLSLIETDSQVSIWIVSIGPSSLSGLSSELFQDRHGYRINQPATRCSFTRNLREVIFFPKARMYPQNLIQHLTMPTRLPCLSVSRTASHIPIRFRDEFINEPRCLLFDSSNYYCFFSSCGCYCGVPCPKDATNRNNLLCRPPWQVLYTRTVKWQWW